MSHAIKANLEENQTPISRIDEFSKLADKWQQEKQSMQRLIKSQEEDINLLKEELSGRSDKRQEDSFSMGEYSDDLLHQLLAIQEELLAYRVKYNKPSTSNDDSKIYYGARQRIEKDLPYRLGKIINEQARSPIGMTKLPKLLSEEYEKFLAEQDDSKPLPPIEAYIDSDDAKRVKNHLNYRIGLVVAQSIGSPKNLLNMPLELAKQIYLFRKSLK